MASQWRQVWLICRSCIRTSSLCLSKLLLSDLQVRRNKWEKYVANVTLYRSGVITFTESFPQYDHLLSFVLLLPGLEAFSSNSLVLSVLDKLAVGKILLMETLQPCPQNETPLAVFYDTSQDEDININSMCLKALQDKTMNNPLSVC